VHNPGLRKLPHASDALEPYIDAQTMQIRHDRHHQGCVDNLNKTVASGSSLSKLTAEELLERLDSLPAQVRTQIRNQGGGHANHSLWQTLAPAAQSGKPSIFNCYPSSQAGHHRSKNAERLRRARWAHETGD
jgi:Fe-Mn family superoxide dismutase